MMQILSSALQILVESFFEISSVQVDYQEAEGWKKEGIYTLQPDYKRITQNIECRKPWKIKHESDYFNKLMAGMMLPRRCKDACIYTMDMDDSGNFE